MLAAISSIMAVLLLCSGLLAQTVIKPSVPHDACTTPEQKQLDFWLGEWDLTWPGEKPGEVARGTNSVRRVLGGCVVEENFDGGQSIPLRE